MSYLTNKAILIISPERWDDLHVSKHHYAIHLARIGNRVFFLNPPSNRYHISSSQHDNLSIVDYKGFFPGIRFLAKPIRNLVTKRVYSRIESMVSEVFDVIWSFDNSVFFDFDALSDNVLKISHIVDLNMDFEVKRSARSADLCFCTTKLIADKLDKYGRGKVFRINHGLAIPEQEMSHVEIPGNNSIKAAYAGNLAMKYLDWRIILSVVEKHPDIDFVFWGSNGNQFDEKINPHHKFKRLVHLAPNTFFPGILGSSKLISSLQAVDILMLSYQEAHHKDQANPHKILEYLFAGKTVVATHTEEYKKSELFRMSKKNSEWPTQFDEVVNDLELCNSTHLREERKSFALENTYQMQINRIEKIIKDNITFLESN